MKPTQLWHRMLTRPAPKRPLRELFLSTALEFFLGLILGPFVPPASVVQQSSHPHRLAFPRRELCRVCVVCGYRRVPACTDGPQGLFPAALVAGSLVVAAGVALWIPLFSGPVLDFNALARTLPVVQRIVYSGAAIILFGAGAGWFRYLQTWYRREQESSTEVNDL